MRRDGTRSEAKRSSGGRRRRAALFGVAVAALSAVVVAQPAGAQSISNGVTYGSDAVVGHRRGGGGLGVGGALAIGVGLGVLGAIAAQSAAADEPGRPPRRARVIELEDDLPPGADPGPGRPRPPKTVQVVTNPNVRVPSRTETRFVPGEVLIEVKAGGKIEPIATRLGLEVLSSLPIRLTGSTLHRLRARDGRSTVDVLTRLRQERTIAFAQPNWVYTLQQEVAGATPGDGSATASVLGGTTAAQAAAADVETAAAGIPAGPLPGQYAAGKLNLSGAHGRVRGHGVLVAVIDTGADTTHPELVGAVEDSFDALEGAPKTPGVHGTAMAGAVAARLRLAGAAPGARLLLARAFGPPAANGVAQGSTFHVVACLDWAVGRGAKVVSMSFAGPSNDLLTRALAAAKAKGVIAVAAAGNAGPQSPPLFPAADPGVIAVTASDPDDRILPAANRGTHVLVTAPGVDILVATPQGGYDLTSGTSVAAAEVSGVVALLAEKRGDLKPDEARRILAETAIDLGPKGRDPIFGAGLVDADAAVAAASRAR